MKFDLDAIPDVLRKTVDEGIVYVDGEEVGSVQRFTGKFHEDLPLEPGSHEVVVRLADGRELDTEAGIEPGHVTHLLLRFSDKPVKFESRTPVGPE